MKRSLLTYAALLALLAPAAAHAQQDEAGLSAEIFIDADPGVGNGTPFTVNDGDNALTLPLGDIATGAHIISVRVKDAAGKWSSTVTNPLYITRITNDTDKLTAEFFIDADPGVGNGTIIAANKGDNTLALPLGDITPGAHIISVRIKDAAGKWSNTVANPLYVTRIVDIAEAEYFIDTDPGEGKGTAVAVADDGTISLSIATDNLAIGEHKLTLRGKTPNDLYVTIFEAPFGVDEANGIAAVEWTIPAEVSRSAQAITITAHGAPQGTTVQIYNASGLCVAQSELSDGTFTHPVSAPGPYIIVVTDPQGRRMVQRVM